MTCSWLSRTAGTAIERPTPPSIHERTVLAAAMQATRTMVLDGLRTHQGAFAVSFEVACWAVEAVRASRASADTGATCRLALASLDGAALVGQARRRADGEIVLALERLP